MAVKTGYSGITIRDLTDDQLRQWFWFNSQSIDTYILTTDTTVVQGKTYYSLINNEFEEVTPEAEDNPAQNRWYEFRENTIPAGAYVLSQPVESFKKTPSEIANLYMQSGAVKLQNGLIPYATLNTSGLFLEKGGITAGTPGYGGFIYLSTENYPDSYSINGSIGVDDWKQIIGTNFGVRSDGTLYASEVNVAGAITAGEGSNVGGWVINDVSIHSEGKDNYDTDVEGIYIGQYNDLELQRKIYTISGGHARYEISADIKIGYVLTEDIIVKSGKKYYKKGWYVLTEDTVVDPEKTYYELEDDQYIEVVPQEGDNPSENEWYEFSTEADVYTEVTPQEGDNPYQNKWYEEKKYYEKVDHYILTQDTIVKNWKVYYKKEDDDYIEIEPIGDENPSEQGWYEFEEYRLVIPIGNENPSEQGWYENIGPMWHINSDGSADFSTLSVSQDGILTVPAASISGALTAAQIEVENLSAISASIGSTINSETTANTLEVDYEELYVLSTDTRCVPRKMYYSSIEVPLLIENPEGSPMENGYYEESHYFLTPDEEIDSGATYYYYDEDEETYEEVTELYFQTEDTEVDFEKKYYILESSEYIEIINQDDYFYATTDTTVDINKVYWEKIDGEWLVVQNPTGNPSTQEWFEQKSPIDNHWYEGYSPQEKNWYEWSESPLYIPSKDETVLEKNYYDLDEIYERIIGASGNPKALGFYEKITESFIVLSTEKNVYSLTNDRTWDNTKIYYVYSERYYNTKDMAPNQNKTYYDPDTYEPIPSEEIEEDTNPFELGWFERSGVYEVQTEEVLDPYENYLYENKNNYSAEITLRNGNVTIDSNDKTVFSINSEEENDVNISDIQVIERIKIGRIELAPFNNGFVIQTGGDI